MLGVQKLALSLSNGTSDPGRVAAAMAAPARAEPTSPGTGPKVLDRMREALRSRHHTHRTQADCFNACPPETPRDAQRRHVIVRHQEHKMERRKYEGPWERCLVKRLLEEGKIYVECPKCGAHIESWTTVVIRKCHKCGRDPGVFDLEQKTTETIEFTSFSSHVQQLMRGDLANDERLRVIRQQLLQVLTKNLCSHSYNVRQFVDQVVDSLDPESILWLVQSNDFMGRSYLVAALGRKRGDAVRRFLLSTVNDRSARPGMRGAAIKALGDSGDESNIGLLTDLLRDDYGGIRIAAMVGLLKIGKKTAVEPISDVLLELREYPDPPELERYRMAEPDSYIDWSCELGMCQDNKAPRLLAAAVLGELSAPEATPALVKALSDPCDHVRRQALKSLQKIDSKEYHAQLIAHVNEINRAITAEDWAWARKLVTDLPSAVQELGSVRGAQAIKTIVDALAVSAGAYASTRYLQPKSLREASIHALALIGRESIPWIRKGLTRSDPAVREACHRALRACGEKPWWRFW